MLALLPAVRANAVVPVREYRVHSGGSNALVVALHGCTQTAADVEAGTGWDAVADREDITIVYPEQSTGLDGNAAGCWNSGQAAALARGDGELEAVAQITRNVAAQYGVPSNRIYMIGLSSGALMANVMAATYPDLYAAFASVEGCSYMCTDPTGDAAYMRMGPYARVMPVMVVQGTADYLTNPAMGELTVDQWLGTDDLADDGAHNQSISSVPASTEQRNFDSIDHADPAHGDACLQLFPRNPCFLGAAGVAPYPTTVRQWWDGHGRVVVESWLVHGLSHNYSGGSYAGSFTDPYGPDITSAAWSFFESHPLTGAFTPAAAASPPLLPSHDPFYTYSGRKPLRTIAPGTVLKRRPVQLAFGPGNSTPIRAEQLLYRTTSQRGRPAVTVTTVLRPTQLPVAPRIIGYLSFYDGLGSQCDPSYTLAGGDPGDSTYAQEAQEEELLISWYLSQGAIVTVPDFEGTHLEWMAGRASGYAALDGIRATENYLRLGPATKVGLSGYSGGSVAADWASELAPAYASKLNLVGVAEGGIPANYFNHLAYMDGTAEYSAAIPGELLGLARAYGIDLTQYLTPRGLELVHAMNDVCIASVFGKYQLSIRDILLPAYRDLAHAEPFATMLRDQTMGTVRTHPRGPLLMAVGNADGKGDGAMPAADVKALARHYCSEGVAVDYQEYPGAGHQEAAALFEPQTGPFFTARFAGVPAVNDCATLGS